MKTRLTIVGILLALLASLAVIPAAVTHAQSAPTSSAKATMQVRGAVGQTFATTEGASVHVNSFTVQRFVTQNGKTVAEGTMSGTVTQNGSTKSFTSTFSAPVSHVATTCPVLFLVLGPLTLNLLGLHIVTNQIIADVFANPSQGLLGSLLCGLANLLGPATVDALLNALLGQPLTALLNAILGLL